MATYTPDQLAQFPWIVSCDTLRPEDLLPKFWSAAEHCAVALDRPQLLNAETLASLTKLVGEDSTEADWCDTEAAQTLEDLREALNEAAPDAFYFGSQPGDGACFGFWLGEDWADLLEHCGWAADSDPAALAALVAELLADGIDPDNYEDAYAGAAEGYDEEEAGADFAQSTVEEQGLLPTVSAWPFYCIDWSFAWRELVLGDGFRVHRISGKDWAVFRAV
jgi:hypothetical protein